METKVKENGAAVNNQKPAAKDGAFINNNPVNKEAAKPQEAKAEEVKKEVPQTEPQQPKAESGQPKAEQQKAAEQHPKAEPAKAETRPVKPALNLEGTLKLVEEKSKGTSSWIRLTRWKPLKWHKSRTGTKRTAATTRAVL